MTEKLKIRSNVKKRKPNYKRVQGHQFKKLSKLKWRRPKGKGNKVRRQRRGKSLMLQVGFKSPKEVRGLNKEGLREILVSNVSDLAQITKGCVAVISSGVGRRKKIEILNEVKKKNIKIAYIKDVELLIKNLTKVKKESKKKEKEVKKKEEDSKKTKSEVKAKKEEQKTSEVKK